MNLEIFLTLLLAVSILTGLTVEAIKEVLKELERPYKANILAGLVAVALSVLVMAGYVTLVDAVINSKMAVYLIALVLLSWLSAMVGYDKVLQAITQIRKGA